ncbi:MAG: uroporphyrinogen decarboxylase family protein [Planctomycetaceae bacterium]
MNKIERVRAILAGQPVDRPAFSVWYHFGNQHASPEKTAEVHLDFFEAYDLDLLKVMNDYDYPLPEGLEAVETVEDLKRIGPLDVTRTPMGNQLRAVEILAGKLKGRALLVDTVFNAWNSLKRYLAKGAMPRLMAEHPEELLAALKVVNSNLIQYSLASIDRGAAGIFLSVPATAETLKAQEYEKFMRPFDVDLLKSLQGKGECHILHAHGEKLYLDRMLDYRVQVLSWADLNGGPTIAEARRKTPLTLMGGVDHVHFPNLSIHQVKDQVRAALAQAGGTRFILAPGCAIPTYSFTPLIRAIREAIHAKAA